MKELAVASNTQVDEHRVRGEGEANVCGHSIRGVSGCTAVRMSGHDVKV